MLITVTKSGGFVGLTQSKAIQSQNLGPLWQEFLTKSKFNKIPIGKSLINPGKTIGRDMYVYTIKTANRQMIYDEGKLTTDPRFTVVGEFVNFIINSLI